MAQLVSEGRGGEGVSCAWWRPWGGNEREQVVVKSAGSQVSVNRSWLSRRVLSRRLVKCP